MTSIITWLCEDGIETVYTNSVIQAGYDYLSANNDPEKKRLGRALDAELRKQGLFSKKAEILQKIAAEFGLGK